MKRKAVQVIVKFVRSKLDQSPISEQIAVYKALAEVMPTVRERQQAKRVAWMLEASAKLQTDFTRQLFREIQWPGHQHDGDGRKGGGQ